METSPSATPRETVEALLKTAGRYNRSVPVRTVFLQQGEQGTPQPGPLAGFVRNSDSRGLDLFLLLKAVASAPPYNSHRSSAVWARALTHTGVSVNEQTVSNIWRRLEDYRLVTRSRHGRLSNVTLLQEDGSGAPYTHPGQKRTGGQRLEDRYFQLPSDYWLDADEKWCETLSMPAKAMLLIALSLAPGFVLPVEKAKPWYGISADTAQRGLAELTKRGAISRKRVPKKAPLAPQGFTLEHRHYLQDPFKARRRSFYTEPSDVS